MMGAEFWRSIVSKFFLRVWLDGFPAEYQLTGQSLRVGFRGRWRTYYLVLRRGADGEDLYSMTLTGTDFYDFALGRDREVSFQAYLLPKYLGEVGGQLGVYEALVWSERMRDFEDGVLEPVKHPPKPLQQLYEEHVSRIIEAEPIYFKRPYLPEYLLAVRIGDQVAAVAWFNAIGGRVEGLYEFPHLLKSLSASLPGRQ